MGRLHASLACLASLRFLTPRWRLPGFLVLGAVAGMGLFVFHISRAASYLSDRPETCMNCHVMTTQYVTWQHSSHARVATCNDCHVPHDSLIRKYAFKARDGLWHSTVFTMRWEPQAIRLSHGAIPVVEENCRRCHAKVIEDVAVSAHGIRATCGAGSATGTFRMGRSVAFRPRRTSSSRGLPSIQDLIQEPTIGGRAVSPRQGVPP